MKLPEGSWIKGTDYKEGSPSERLETSWFGDWHLC